MLTELISEIRYRLRSVFRRGSVERELDDELRFHLEREAEKHMANGMPRDAALRRARLDFGGVERIKDDTRDTHGTRLLDGFLQDLHYAWRGIRTKPGFALAVVLTLGLGLGANTAMFGIVDRLLFRSPPFLQNGNRVHRVYLSATRDGSRLTVRNHSYARFNDLSAGTRSFTRTAAFANRPVALGTGEDTREMIVGAVSASYFELFDAPPVLGRYFLPEEDAPPSGSPVLVLSYAFWQSRYGGRADVLGRTLQTGNRIATIVGVAPEGFIGASEDGAGPVAWMPITAYAEALRGPGYVGGYGWTWLEMLAERKTEVSTTAASADLTQAFVRSYEAHRLVRPSPPASEARPVALAGPVQYARGPLARSETKVATWVSGVATIVLLVACANVANLLLARAVLRRREIALRLALGVTRGRLVRQLLTESMVLAGLGGIVALGLAQLGARVMGALFLSGSDAVPVLGDGRSLAFLGVVTLGVALLTGIAPALAAARGDVVTALKTGREGSRGGSRLRAGLLLSQMVLCVVLLVGAALFVGSLSRVRAMRLGYDIDPVLYAAVNLRSVRLSGPEQGALAKRLLEVVQATPGVTAGTPAVSVPFRSNREDDLTVPGIDSVALLGRFLLQAGSPDYFTTMGTSILHGRGMTAADGPQSPRVVVVSEGMARVLWPGRDAIGQQIRIGGDDMPYSTVVGVAEDVRARLISGEPEYWYYLPDAQYQSFPELTLLARVNGNAADFAESLRRRLQAAMPGDGYVIVQPMEELVGPNRRSWELGATMFVVFGGLALVLATVGLYSVIAYTVAQRTHELGVRVALGASSRTMLWLVVGQGVGFAAFGIAIGSGIALLAGPSVRPLLFDQSPNDPVVFALVAAVLLLVAVAASAGPARRAVRADPTVALRAE